MKEKYLLLFTVYCLLFTVILCGCGEGPGSPGSSGSENTGVKVDASVEGLYLGQPTYSVDAFRGICDEGPPPEYEDFTDHQATVTFTARLLNPNSTFQAGKLYIEKYTVEFRRKPDSISAPPIEFYPGFASIVIHAPTGAGEVTVTTDIRFVDLIRKDQYAEDVLSGRYSSWLAYINNYTAIFTFEGKNEYGEEFTVKTQMDFQIGNFDNC
ncbi:MAG: hypothetical protein FJ240_00010 [Nitrospira sp.]|nr:hypothetical protein [Nitrospira sp.]